MLVLSKSEAEELLEHLEARPDIWVTHNGIWARCIGPSSYGLAISVRNGQPNGLWALTIKPLTWSADASKEYVVWLLEKYTAYSMRQRIVSILGKAVKSTIDVNVLSRDLCELHGGTFVRKHIR